MLKAKILAEEIYITGLVVMIKARQIKMELKRKDIINE